MPPETLFYDGACGLCHRSVRFVLERDAEGRFRFAPLDGPTFRAQVPPERRAGLPDSMVLVRDDGELLLRSDAAIHLLRGLGGGWRALAGVLALLPRALRDTAYDGIARIRKRVFAAPADACPVVPPPLRARFEP